MYFPEFGKDITFTLPFHSILCCNNHCIISLCVVVLLARIRLKSWLRYQILRPMSLWLWPRDCRDGVWRRGRGRQLADLLHWPPDPGLWQRRHWPTWHDLLATIELRLNTWPEYWPLIGLTQLGQRNCFCITESEYIYFMNTDWFKLQGLRPYCSSAVHYQAPT